MKQQLRDLIHNFTKLEILNNYFNLQDNQIIISLHRIYADPIKLESDGPNSSIVISRNYLNNFVNYFKSRNYKFIDMDEHVDNLKIKSFKGKSIALTFDDGYIDNYENLSYLTNEHNIKATIYITTGFPDKNIDLWWYSLWGYIENNYELIHPLSGKKIKIHKFEEKKKYFNQIRNLYMNKSLNCKKLIGKFYKDKWPLDLSEYCMSWDQIKKLSQNPNLCIGSHTLTHPILSFLKDEESRMEISKSKERLEQMLNKRINHFAIPFGHLNSYSRIRDLAYIQDSGYISSVTTIAKPYNNHSIFELPRYFLNDNVKLKNFEMGICGINKLLKRQT